MIVKLPDDVAGELLVCGGEESVGGSLHTSTTSTAHSVRVRVNVSAKYRFQLLLSMYAIPKYTCLLLSRTMP
jgi:vacuolar-type H+-ATPase subunit I/STV1